MPLYTYHCMRCEAQRVDMKPMEQRHDGPFCDHCGNRMILSVDPVRGIVKNPAVPRSKP